MHPQPRVRNKKAHEHSHHRFTENIGPSLRNGFNGYFVLSPATGLFCHRRQRNTFRQLDTSVGVSGPHDFAVRIGGARLRRPRVHRIPLPTFVTIAKRPLVRRGQREEIADLG